VKVAKGDIYSQANSIAELKFQDQQLTSFAGLVVFQKLFRSCRLKERLEESCAHLLGRHYYLPHKSKFQLYLLASKGLV
jgi:hypothetical protein